RAKVADFGLARMMAEHRPTREVTTEDWLPYGTPSYMPPETLEGKRGDARSDQWSFCVSVWETLDGEVPFPGLTRTTLLESIAKGPRVINLEVPERVRDVLRVGLAVDPCDRYPDMETLVAELARLVSTDSEEITPGASATSSPDDLEAEIASASAEAEVKLAPAPEPEGVEVVASSSPERSAPWNLVLMLGGLGGFLAMLLVLGVFFAVEKDPTETPRLFRPDRISAFHNWYSGLCRLADARAAAKRGDLQQGYVIWLDGHRPVMVHTPVLAGTASLDLASIIGGSEHDVDKYIAAMIADVAGQAFQKVGAWTQATTAREQSAKLYRAVDYEISAAQQDDCAAEHRQHRPCYSPSAQPTDPSSLE
ncbi:MAG: protein kinase, partial [Planctomycetes bacterium]|nr:protein kinase [Planctomycetota bacterium]